MGWVMILSLLIVTVLYLLINLSYLRVLAIPVLAGSDAVAADVMDCAFGPGGAAVISVLIAVAAYTSATATAITGARSPHALCRNFPLLRWLSPWHSQRATPANPPLVMQKG